VRDMAAGIAGRGVEVADRALADRPPAAPAGEHQLPVAAELAPGPIVAKLASRFLALTAVRLAALRGAEWSEIEGVDFSDRPRGRENRHGPAPQWRIPAGRMKLTKVRKADPAASHVVPLSRQAVAVLLELRELAGDGELMFPGRRRGRPIGEGAIGDLYAAAGYSGRHVPHGWRASFSTILNERFPEDRALIDQALAHASAKGRVEAAYNRSQQQARMRDLFQRWADLLEPAGDARCEADRKIGTELATLSLESLGQA